MDEEQVEDQEAPFTRVPFYRRSVPIDSRFRKYVYLLNTAFTFYVCLSTPFQACFQHETVSLWVVAYVLDVAFIFSMVFESSFQFYSNGALKTSISECHRNYLRHSFKFDLLSILPTDLFCFIFTDTLQGLAYLRLNRVFRITKIPQYFGEKEDDIKKNTTPIRLFKFSLLVVIVTHWITCCWYLLSCRNGDDSCEIASWGNSDNISFNMGAGLFNRYVSALYWSVATTTTTGYGDISATTTEEQWVSIVFMFLGVVMYGFILGSLASILSNRDVLAFLYADRLHIRSEYMKELDLPESVQKRITGYYKYVWLRNKGRDRNTLFSGMPLTFQAEISLSINRQMLSRVPLFKNADIGFLRMLSMVIKPYLYLPGEIIVHEEDIGRELFYLARGNVEISKLENGEQKVVATLTKGGFIGETCMAYSTARSASMRAVSHCDIFVLTKKDIDKVLQHYPEIGQKIIRVSNQRFNYAEKHVHDDIMSRVQKKKSKSSLGSTSSHSFMGFVRKCSAAVGEFLHGSHHSSQSKRSSRTNLKPSASSLNVIPSESAQEPAKIDGNNIVPEIRTPDNNSVSGSIGSSNPRESVMSISDEEYEATQLMGTKKLSSKRKPLSFSSGRLTTSTSTTSIARKKSTVSQMKNEDEDYISPLSIFSGGESSQEDELKGSSILETVILPDSLFGRRWGYFMITATVFDAILLSYQASFAQQNVGLFVVTYFVDLCFIADMVLKFHTAYKGKNGQLVADLYLIATRYLKGMFIVDLISIFPIELLALFGSSTEEQLRWMSYLKLGRLLKVYRISRLFSRIDEELGSKKGLIRSIKFLIYIILITHIGGCGYHLIACPDNDECLRDTWLGANTLDTSSPFTRYVASIYWAAATTTSTGYGDIRAVGTLERAYSIVVMIMGLLLYGTILATVAATIANSDIERTNFGEKFDAIMQFMNDSHMSVEMRKRIIDYYEYLWARSKGIDLKTLFDDIPSTLQLELTMHVNHKCLESVPLFKNSEIAYIRSLSLRIKPHLFMPNEYILHRGDIGREMYFIQKGYADVLGVDDKTVIATLGPESYFGEISLVFSVPRTASIRAQSYCDVLMLTKDEFDHVLESFSNIRKEIDEIATNRQYIEKVKEAIAALSKEKRGSNNSNLSDGEILANRVSMASNNANTKIIQQATLSRKSEMELEKQNAIKKSLTDMSYGIRENKRRATISSTMSKTSLRYVRLSKTEKLLSRFLMTRSIYSNSNAFRTWENVSLCLCTLITYTVPFQAAFGHDIVTLWVINYLFDLVFVLDIYIRLHLSFYDKNGVLITNPIATAKHYFKGNFIPDAVASFPTDIFCLAASSNTLFVLALVRLNRVIRFYRPLQYLSYRENKISANNFMIRCLKFLYAMLAFNHWVACVWFVNACNTDCSGNKWAVSGSRNLNDSTVFFKYVISLYWTFTTLTSLGYGDIIGATDGERILSIVVMISGIVFYGLVIGSIAGALANAGKQRARYVEKLSAIKGFMKDQNLDLTLRKRVSGYYEYIWRRNKGVNTRTLFRDIPLTFQAEIALSVNQQIIEKVPLFQNTEIGFLRMLSMAIRPLLLLKKEYIVHKGDIGNEMFFIHKGTVDVVSPDGAIVFASMHAGSFFGEISLIFSVPRTASIRTATNCDLFVLSKNDLDAVLKFYPDIEKQINEEASIRFEAARKRNEDDKKKSTIVAPPPTIKDPNEENNEKSANEKPANEIRKNASDGKLNTLTECRTAEQSQSATAAEDEVQSNIIEDLGGEKENNEVPTVTGVEMPSVIVVKADGSGGSDPFGSLPSVTKSQEYPANLPNSIEQSQNEQVIEEKQSVVVIENSENEDDNESICDSKGTRSRGNSSGRDSPVSKGTVSVESLNSEGRSSDGNVADDSENEEKEESAERKKDEKEEEEEKEEKKEEEPKKEKKEEKAEKNPEAEEQTEVPPSRISKLVKRFSEWRIHPESASFRNIHLLRFILSYISCFSVAYQAVFASEDVGLIVFNFLFDIFFIVDIFFSLRTGFIDENQQTVFDLKNIRKRFFKESLILVLVSNLPFEVFCLAFSSSSTRYLWLGYFRLTKLGRVHHVMSYFEEKQQSLSSNEVLSMIEKFSLITFLLTHWVGCAWFLIACQGDHCFAFSWVSKIPIFADRESGTDYSYSMYWAVTTLTTTGYGDITPQNSTEMIYGMFIMALGKLYFGFILGTIASSLANALSQEVRYKERVESIIEYIKDQGVAEQLQSRIIRYYEYLWMRNKGVDGVDLFTDMPMTLQAEVSLGINADVISKVPLFKNSDDGFMRMLSLVIKPYLYLPKEYIVQKGDIGKEMFIIHRGVVEVVSDDSPPIVYDTMEAGNFFGEVSLMFPVPRTASIRAKNYVDMFVLTKEDLQSVLKHFPEYEAQIEEIANQRRSTALKRAQSNSKIRKD